MVDVINIVLGALACILGVSSAVMIWAIPQIISLKKDFSDFMEKEFKPLKEKVDKLDERTELMMRVMEFLRVNYYKDCGGEE
mgnify:CR=1 FL=1